MQNKGKRPRCVRKEDTSWQQSTWSPLRWWNVAYWKPEGERWRQPIIRRADHTDINRYWKVNEHRDGRLRSREKERKANCDKSDGEIPQKGSREIFILCPPGPGACLLSTTGHLFEASHQLLICPPDLYTDLSYTLLSSWMKLSHPDYWIWRMRLNIFLLYQNSVKIRKMCYNLLDYSGLKRFCPTWWTKPLTMYSMSTTLRFA